MPYVLGIDGGGSKTVCVLMDDSGQVLGRGEAGGSNYQSIGIEATFKSIESAIEAAANEAIEIIKTITIEAICLGLAGVGRASDIEVVKSLVVKLQNSKNLPVNWALQPENIVICNDAFIALVGGIGHDVGIVVAVGTGSIVFGRNQQGNTKRVGGWGYILGDEGSAYKIAVAGMNAALKSYDGREITTTLVDAFKEHLNLENIEDLIEVIYRRQWGVKQIAALAPIVDLAAASGDEVANNIIDDAVKELVKATSVVIDAIFSPDSIYEVVTTGSVWLSRAKIYEKFSASIINKFPFIQVIYPRFEPAYGAALLAFQRLRRGGE
ncbi:MAG: N-acetylglucosamine kinase [Nostoc sp. ZfuVER08]|jgi:N-acetylglucosamine kinase|uniref:ATPase n=1 Tax=Nostoc punctiforme FACHB-252 TaxID=1357509 RepID=A0ABR8H3Z4_NOSPU|nr:BadF/BadG/BcrA/BcrD ATPase family protein [Nostoc punctiforme]MBD2610118.1 ATPase [Nostoc punctiforme FACHB-252]MBL1197783.1 ATPase [Nostoc sp. GBBB01]MDZ8016003.1 BadF/BadG/BcrA/BcrD ATPase family protein [Nostoc sp. ZfuVER08]